MKTKSAVLFCAAALAAAAASAAVDPLEATSPKAYTNAAGKVLLYRVMGPAKMESGRKYGCGRHRRLRLCADAC